MAEARSKRTPLYRRILVGYDGSDRARKAVDRAVEVAGATGATLTILGVGDPDTLRPSLDAAARAFPESGVEIDTQVEGGNPAAVIMAVAERGGYDLVVLGNKGMTGIERFRLGSVPNKVSHHLPCSLLIVRTG